MKENCSKKAGLSLLSARKEICIDATCAWLSSEISFLVTTATKEWFDIDSQEGEAWSPL